jgi:hypothetical protein
VGLDVSPASMCMTFSTTHTNWRTESTLADGPGIYDSPVIVSPNDRIHSGRAGEFNDLPWLGKVFLCMCHAHVESGAACQAHRPLHFCSGCARTVSDSREICRLGFPRHRVLRLESGTGNGQQALH